MKCWPALPNLVNCTNVDDTIANLGHKVCAEFSTELRGEALLAIGLDIGINGCSLKTDENLETARRIPRDRVLLETDAPSAKVAKLAM